MYFEDNFKHKDKMNCQLLASVFKLYFFPVSICIQPGIYLELYLGAVH